MGRLPALAKLRRSGSDQDTAGLKTHHPLEAKEIEGRVGVDEERG
jgi:hypothetical protein